MHDRHISGMQRRHLLTFALLPALLPASSAWAQSGFQPNVQERAELGRIQNYLDSLRTLKARFLQVSSNGTTARGVAWIERPGRMRFQYDPPTPYLLVAGHGLLVFHDSELNQTSNIPLGRTPLGILLADHVHLSGDVTVTGMQHLPGQIQVSLVRTETPSEGTLTLVFADNPLTLRQWTVTDAQRQETRVTLYDVQLGGSFDPNLFDYIAPAQPSTGGGG